MEIEGAVELNRKLDRVLHLLAILAVRGLGQAEQIAALNRAGFAPKEIAGVVGTTSNTVRVTLVGIRRAEALGGRRKKVKQSLREDDNA